MGKGELGKRYRDGELIVQQGDPGDCMYVIQEGEVEVFRAADGGETPLAVLGKDEFFGEVPLFERQDRSASVRAKGDVRVLTVDRKTLLRRIQEDPTLAYRILETMSRRIRTLDTELSRLMGLFGGPPQD
jgi:CRP-like cAMP-binding protein